MTLASADLPGAILLDANLTGVSLDLAKGCAADKPRPRRRR